MGNSVLVLLFAELWNLVAIQVPVLCMDIVIYAWLLGGK